VSIFFQECNCFLFTCSFWSGYFMHRHEVAYVTNMFFTRNGQWPSVFLYWRGGEGPGVCSHFLDLWKKWKLEKKKEIYQILIPEIIII
jgi:hypothetical protein